MSRVTLKHLVLSSLLLIFSVGVCGIAVYQIHKEGKVLSEQVSVLLSEQSQEDSYYRLQKISEETKEERSKVGAYFIRQGSDSIDFLNRVESLAPQAGVTLKTENLEELSDKKAGTKWIDVEFSFSGSQENVERFLHILENLPYFSQVTSATLSEGTTAQWEANVSMRISLITP